MKKNNVAIPYTEFSEIMKTDVAKLISLLDNGAHLYICGDGSRMAPDVEATLCQAYQEYYGERHRANALSKTIWKLSAMIFSGLI